VRSTEPILDSLRSCLFLPFFARTCAKRKLHLVEDVQPIELYNLLSAFIKNADEYLSNNKVENEELMDLYFDIHSFLSISEFYDENYKVIYQDEYKTLSIKLYCVNPSKVIIDRMKKAKSNIIFSATLIPMDYFKDMYGSKEGDYI